MASTDGPPAGTNPQAYPEATAPIEKAPRPWYKKKRWWALGAILFLAIASQLGGDDETSTVATEPTPTVQATTPAPTTEEPTTPADTPTPTPEATPEPEPEPEEPEMTTAQRNAIRSAENYLSFTAFSREGLIEQLEFEDYSTEDATFAVDNIEVDWNEQAALKAETYLDMSGFSRQGLIDQLVFEGFTTEQANFGADAVGL